MYAVVETGGKQYRVAPGDRIQVPRLGEEAGTVVSLERVLLVATEGAVSVGTPTLDSAKVSAEIVAHGRSPKITVFKKKRRKEYERLNGHRQPYTTLEIKDIQAP